jgi:hypothetical protein
MKVGQLVLGGMEVELENVSLDQLDKQMQHVLYYNNSVVDQECPREIRFLNILIPFCRPDRNTCT